MPEFHLGTIFISGVELHVIARTENNNTTHYITQDLEDRIPVGLIVNVPGYNQPFIYFDELEGPQIFPHFCENMHYYSLNWFKEPNKLRTMFRNMRNESFRILDQMIVGAQQEINDRIDDNGINDQMHEDQMHEDQMHEDQTHEDQIHDDQMHEDQIPIA